MLIEETDIVLRIFVGAILGALVGFERERQDQPAGLRTHMLLVIGSTLGMVLSINVGYLYARPGLPYDPTRLAAQIISGIGFLGVGAILRYGYNIKGLTTATSMWTMAIVGMAVGAGYYLIGTIATVLILIILSVLNVAEKRFMQAVVTKIIEIEVEYLPGVVKATRKTVKEISDEVLSFAIQRHAIHNRLRLRIVVRLSKENSLSEMLESISGIAGVRKLKIT